MENIMLGIQVTIFGFGAVFLALSVLATLLSLQATFMKRKKESVSQVATVQKEVSVQQVEEFSQQQITAPGNEPDDLGLVAAITAAVTQMMAQQSGYTPQIRITSIAPAADAWRMRGRGNLISSRSGKRS